MRWMALIGILAVAGCMSPAAMPQPAGQIAVDLAQTAPALKICPPKVDYTQAQLDQFAAALAALDEAKPNGYQIIEGFLTDYHNMRNADDICLHPHSS